MGNGGTWAATARVLVQHHADARRALDLVWSFFQNQPAGILEPDEYSTIGKLMVKLKLSHGPDRTPVLPGGIYPVDRSLSPRVSKKRND